MNSLFKQISSQIPKNKPVSVPMAPSDMLELATSYQECGAETIDYCTLTPDGAVTSLVDLRQKLNLSDDFALTSTNLSNFSKPNQDVADLLRLTCFIELGSESFMTMYSSTTTSEQDPITIII